jgi:hypothetical protein
MPPSFEHALAAKDLPSLLSSIDGLRQGGTGESPHSAGRKVLATADHE